MNGNDEAYRVARWVIRSGQAELEECLSLPGATRTAHKALPEVGVLFRYRVAHHLCIIANDEPSLWDALAGKAPATEEPWEDHKAPATEVIDAPQSADPEPKPDPEPGGSYGWETSIRAAMQRATDVPGYERLRDVLEDAYAQAARGKGKERHALDEAPFDRQPMQRLIAAHGVGFATGQACKKAEEALNMSREAASRELLGAIVYLAGAIVWMDDNEDEDI